MRRHQAFALAPVLTLTLTLCRSSQQVCVFYNGIFCPLHVAFDLDISVIHQVRGATSPLARHVIHHIPATSPLTRHAIHHIPATSLLARHVIHHTLATSLLARHVIHHIPATLRST
jgi:hypothetical protein